MHVQVDLTGTEDENAELISQVDKLEQVWRVTVYQPLPSTQPHPYADIDFDSDPRELYETLGGDSRFYSYSDFLFCVRDY